MLNWTADVIKKRNINFEILWFLHFSQAWYAAIVFLLIFTKTMIFHEQKNITTMTTHVEKLVTFVYINSFYSQG